MAKPIKVTLTAESTRAERRTALIKNAECFMKFRDKNGKLQTARSTLHPDIIPEVEGQIGGNKRDRICFFNRDKSAFRTVMNDGFVSLHYFVAA